MHPAIKIVSLVILTIFSTQGSWLTLFISTLFLLPFYLHLPDLWLTVIKMLLRLKWFFLSIFILYYYYTPQINSLEAQSLFIVNNFVPGLFRISVLVTILFAVNLFIKTSSKEEILAALVWLFSPLKFFHIDSERISLRAVLSLQYIEDLSLRLSLYKKNHIIKTSLNSENSFINTVKQKKQSLLHLIEHSGIILNDILMEAENTSGKRLTIEPLAAPLIKQILFPIVLSLSLYLTL